MSTKHSALSTEAKSKRTDVTMVPQSNLAVTQPTKRQISAAAVSTAVSSVSASESESVLSSSSSTLARDMHGLDIKADPVKQESAKAAPLVREDASKEERERVSKPTIVCEVPSSSKVSISNFKSLGVSSQKDTKGKENQTPVARRLQQFVGPKRQPSRYNWGPPARTDGEEIVDTAPPDTDGADHGTQSGEQPHSPSSPSSLTLFNYAPSAISSKNLLSLATGESPATQLEREDTPLKIGQSRARQGTARDYEPSVSASKKPRREVSEGEPGCSAILAAGSLPPASAAQNVSTLTSVNVVVNEGCKKNLDLESEEQQSRTPITGGGLKLGYLAVGTTPNSKVRSSVADMRQNGMPQSPSVAARTSFSSNASQTTTGSLKAPALTVPANIPTEVVTGKSARPVMMVNNRPFTRLEVLGKGGSSKVYKVIASNYRIFALKRVLFEKADPFAIDGYVNEINLLKRLSSNKRIVRLWDAEINYSKGYLILLMECGEIDLAHLLLNQADQPVSMNFIRMYWEQMLQTVQVIHDEMIVHSDLKPANFLLVEGSLKLIDFGIAKAIANDTTNIHREHQIGTVNYMSPEAISDTNISSGRRLMKLGRSSDVWSLGCILYQMVYGKTPFQDITNVYHKLAQIPNPSCVIEFPAFASCPVSKGKASLPEPSAAIKSGSASGTTLSSSAVSTSRPPHPPVPVEPDLLRVMKSCLQRNPRDRMTIPELLQDPFLKPSLRAMSTPETQEDKTTKGTVPVDALTMEKVLKECIGYCQQTKGNINMPTEAQIRTLASSAIQQLYEKKEVTFR